MPPMWGGGRLSAQRLRVPRATAFADPFALGGRLRRTDRARGPPFQVRRLAPARRASRAASGRAPRGRRGRGTVGRRRAPASVPRATARLQPVVAVDARGRRTTRASSSSWSTRTYACDTAASRPGPKSQVRERCRRVRVEGPFDDRRGHSFDRRRGHHGRHSRCLRGGPQSRRIRPCNGGQCRARECIVGGRFVNSRSCGG